MKLPHRVQNSLIVVVKLSLRTPNLFTANMKLLQCTLKLHAAVVKLPQHTPKLPTAALNQKKLAHKFVSTHNKIASLCPKVASKFVSSKHMHVGSSFEVLDPRILEVKTDINSNARFESYDFFKCIVINTYS